MLQKNRDEMKRKTVNDAYIPSYYETGKIIKLNGKKEKTLRKLEKCKQKLEMKKQAFCSF